MANFFPLQPSDSVKITDGTEEALITASGQINTTGDLQKWLADNATFFSYSQSTSGTKYTVPAGKIAYITLVHVDLNGEIDFKTGATVNFALRSPSSIIGICVPMMYKLIAGQTVVSGGAQPTSFCGWEYTA